MHETSPETNRYGNRTLTSRHDGWDNEHIWVGSYTSVIGNNVVNTVRITRSYENVGGGPPAWFDLDGRTLRDGQMRNLTPALAYDSFWDGVAPWAGARIDSQWQYNNTTSWFIPDKMGDHDIKFGGTFHRAFIDDFRESYLGGAFYFYSDLPFDVDDYRTYPERLRIRVGRENGRQFDYPINTWETFFQDKWTLNERWDGGARRPVGRRDAECAGDRQSADGAGDRPARLEQHLAAVVARLRRDGGRPVRHPGGLRALLRPDALQRARQRPAGSDLQRLVHRQLPPGGAAARAGRKIPGRGTTCRSRTPSWRKPTASARRRPGSAGRRPPATACRTACW